MDIIIGYSAHDYDSGIFSARWWIGTFPGAYDVLQPQYVDYRLRGGAYSVSGLADGVQYYASLEIVNNAGNFAIAQSDGFKVSPSL